MNPIAEELFRHLEWKFKNQKRKLNRVEKMKIHYIKTGVLTADRKKWGK
jgi:hypothetical protein